jgi:hypothetical protein
VLSSDPCWAGQRRLQNLDRYRDRHILRPLSMRARPIGW